MDLTLKEKTDLLRQKKTAKTLIVSGVFFIAFSFCMPKVVAYYLTPFKQDFSIRQMDMVQYYQSVKPTTEVEKKLLSTGQFLVGAYGENVRNSSQVVFQIYFLMSLFIGVLFLFFGVNNFRMIKSLDKFIEG